MDLSKLREEYQKSRLSGFQKKFLNGPPKVFFLEAFQNQDSPKSCSGKPMWRGQGALLLWWGEATPVTVFWEGGPPSGSGYLGRPWGRTTGGAAVHKEPHTPDDPKGSADLRKVGPAC